MRCICCDLKLEDTEMKKKKMDGSWEDMCTSCVGKSRSQLVVWDYSFTRDSIFDIIKSDGTLRVEEIPGSE